MKKAAITGLIFLFMYINICALDIPFFYEPASGAAVSGANTAGADDETALYYNPAGMVYVKKNTISIDGKIMNYDFLGETAKENYFNSGVSAGAAFKGFGFRAVFTQAGDKLTVDAQGNSYLEDTLLLTGGFGYDLGAVKAGAAFNIIALSGIAEGVSFDAGMLFEINERVRTGVAVKNLINSSFIYVLDDYSILSKCMMPVFVNIGINFRPVDFISFNFDIDNVFEARSRVELMSGVPAEYVFKRQFKLGIQGNAGDNFIIKAGIKSGENKNNSNPFENEYAVRTSVSAGVGYVNNILKVEIVYFNDFRTVNGTKNPGGFMIGSGWYF
ncbi:MAG: hypothetical protein JXR81_05325 [Candidatus Goldbacteria bacterium]|nr:hypothetical protein [Candidatus Goldiibacteriota bacterium]